MSRQRRRATVLIAACTIIAAGVLPAVAGPRATHRAADHQPAQAPWAPTASLEPRGLHKLDLVVDAGRQHATQMWIYVTRGTQPVGTPTTRPSGLKPAFHCIGSRCPSTLRYVRITSLPELTTVTISDFATNKSGKVGRFYVRDLVHHYGHQVSGPGQPWLPAASRGQSLVLDGKGVEHVVSATRNYVYYLTRGKRAKQWRTTKLPEPAPRATTAVGSTGWNVQSGLSTDGQDMWTVATTCRRVYVDQVPVGAKKMPALTGIAQVDRPDCDSGGDGPGGANEQYISVAGAVGVSYHGIGILGANSNGKPTFDTVRPTTSGGFTDSFTSVPLLEGSAQITPALITTDSANGDLIAIGYTSSGEQGGNRETAIYLWRRKGLLWSAATKIATVPRDHHEYTVASAAADDGHVWIGFDTTESSSGTDGIGLLAGKVGGTWTGIKAMPGTTKDDNDVLLAINDATGHLHAAYLHSVVDAGSTTHHWVHPREHGGIRETALVSGKWNRPQQVTHYAEDRPGNLQLRPAGHPVILFWRD